MFRLRRSPRPIPYVTIAALTTVLIGVCLQVFVSGYLAVHGLGGSRMWGCRHCGASRLFIDGMLFEGQYIPMYTRRDWATVEGDRHCQHAWKIGDKAKALRLSPWSVANSGPSAPSANIRWPAIMILASHMCLVLGGAVLVIHACASIGPHCIQSRTERQDRPEGK